MLALIMAGGKGSRLGMGEKPLATICQKPMISYIIDAIEGYGCEIVVVASSRTPMTKNWCKMMGIPVFNASGEGYVEDIIETVMDLEEDKPLFTCVSDLPCLSRDILQNIHDAYDASGKDACSCWVPADLFERYRCQPRYTVSNDGTQICPAGINILRGDKIADPQEELCLVLSDKRLVFNINTREELVEVQKYLCPDMHR